MPVGREPPPIPSPQAPIVDENNRPTTEFLRFMQALQEWAKAVNAAIP